MLPTDRLSLSTLPFMMLISSVEAEPFVVEKLGSVERQAQIRGRAFSPGTKQYPPRLLIAFSGEDGNWIVNLKSGKSRKVRSPGFSKDYLQWPSFTGADGKVFTACGRGGLAVYDPLTDSMKMIRPIPKARWLRGMAIGPDGAVYVSDYPTGSAARYNPKTGKVTNFGRQGGPFCIPNIYGYSVGFDGRYVYTAVGKIPWYVVAYDITTGKQKHMIKLSPADHPEVHQRGKQVFLEVKYGDPKRRVAKEIYRLHNCQMERTNVLPRFDDSYVPGHELPQPKIEPLDRNLAIAQNGASVRYMWPGKPWQAAKMPVVGQDLTVQRISSLSNGRLIIATGPYGNVHQFDPRTKKLIAMGSPASRNVYDLLEANGNIYFCGYPNAVFGSFTKTGGAILGNWHDSLRSKHTTFIVKGADGRIYSGNHNERESTGGALGWYDPITKQFGGMHFPNDDCEYLTTASKGRYIIYASDFSVDPTHPEITKRNGKLLIYDTQKHRIIKEISPLRNGSAGVCIEAMPGILFGIGRHNKVPTMYTAAVLTGKVQRKQLSGPTVRSITRGPDGKVYFFMNGDLIRATLETFQIETLCKVEPGRMVFLKNDLYIAGTTQLRRITNATRKR